MFDKDKQLKGSPHAYNDPHDLLETAYKVLRKITIKKNNRAGTDKESNDETNRA